MDKIIETREGTIKVEDVKHVFPIIREIMNWSRDDFAKRVGITRQYVTDLENNKENVNFSKRTSMAVLFVLKDFEDNQNIKKIYSMLINHKVDEKEFFMASMYINACKKKSIPKKSRKTIDEIVNDLYNGKNVWMDR